MSNFFPDGSQEKHTCLPSGLAANPYIEEIVQLHLENLEHDIYTTAVIDTIMYGLFNTHYHHIYTNDVDMEFLLDLICNHYEYREEM